VRRTQLIIFVIALLVLTACGASAASYNNDGNEEFEADRFDEALDDYTAATLEDPDLAQPYYNAGNAFHRKGEVESAVAQIEQSLRTADESLAQQAFYNLGNTYFGVEDWPSAIKAYKEALRLNPSDLDAKNNLELALQKLQEQQQRQQNQQGGQNNQEQEQENEGNQQQQGGQQQQPQQQDQQDNQGQGEGEQDNQDNSSGNQNQQEQDQGRSELSPEEAKQLLDALGQGNQTLQERLQQGFAAPGAPPAKDW
jgi:Ca-activated chloride channel family protein